MPANSACDVRFAPPQYWYDLTPAQRSQRAQLSADHWIIDDQHFFAIGRLLLPVHGEEPFELLVW